MRLSVRLTGEFGGKEENERLEVLSQDYEERYLHRRNTQVVYGGWTHYLLQPPLDRVREPGRHPQRGEAQNLGSLGDTVWERIVSR